jgi:hypothetical protein
VEISDIALNEPFNVIEELARPLADILVLQAAPTKFAKLLDAAEDRTTKFDRKLLAEDPTKLAQPLEAAKFVPEEYVAAAKELTEFAIKPAKLLADLAAAVLAAAVVLLV